MNNNNLQIGGRSRFSICEIIGKSYLVSNIENGEFSYVTALKNIGKDIKQYKIRHKYIDLRFENERLVILVETKKRFKEYNKKDIQNQLRDYVILEKHIQARRLLQFWQKQKGMIYGCGMESLLLLTMTTCLKKLLCVNLQNMKTYVLER